ncbi:class I SAM-dependent methyltransferase [Aestuariimicrobium ganziense]|uniref:class I SAM-dependent methyltransferase n=1 Tax=Aestuariimicrobium ganziense TaxID=2773677 RepID=UPI001F441243|nr:class I SAM-dependent methyltransferase [Aestuariimicrobium ganziense]
MPDAAFAHPRLAQVYDPLDPDRSDLDHDVAMVTEFGATRVLDLGCGTGTFACLLSGRGTTVIGVDPAEASLEVAHPKPGADRVHWLPGTAPDVHSRDDLPLPVEIATMTGDVAQDFLTDEQWLATLTAARQCLRLGGLLVFEARDPDRRIWEDWKRDWTSAAWSRSRATACSRPGVR